MNPINFKERGTKFLGPKLLVPELHFLDQFCLVALALPFVSLEAAGYNVNLSPSVDFYLWSFVG